MSTQNVTWSARTFWLTISSTRRSSLFSIESTTNGETIPTRVLKHWSLNDSSKISLQHFFLGSELTFRRPPLVNEKHFVEYSIDCRTTTVLQKLFESPIAISEACRSVRSFPEEERLDHFLERIREPSMSDTHHRHREGPRSDRMVTSTALDQYGRGGRPMERN